MGFFMPCGVCGKKERQQVGRKPQLCQASRSSAFPSEIECRYLTPHCSSDHCTLLTSTQRFEHTCHAFAPYSSQDLLAIRRLAPLCRALEPSCPVPTCRVTSGIPVDLPVEQPPRYCAAPLFYFPVPLLWRFPNALRCVSWSPMIFSVRSVWEIAQRRAGGSVFGSSRLHC